MSRAQHATHRCISPFAVVSCHRNNPAFVEKKALDPSGFRAALLVDHHTMSLSITPGRHMIDELISEKSQRNERATSLARGIGIGIALGAGIGVAMNDIAIGLGIGVALGVALGSITGRKQEPPRMQQ